MLDFLTGFIREEMERIRQGVISPAKWLEGANILTEKQFTDYLRMARASNAQLEAWAEKLPVIEQEDTPEWLASSQGVWLEEIFVLKS